MARNYEYRVCNVQQTRVTFVNGAWQGSVALDYNAAESSMNSCPHVWDYLQSAGYDGWELAGAVGQDTRDGSFQVLYLKREF